MLENGELKSKIEVLYGEPVGNISEYKEYYVISFKNKRNVLAILKEDGSVLKFDVMEQRSNYGVGFGVNGVQRRTLNLDINNLSERFRQFIGLMPYLCDLFGKCGVSLTNFKYKYIDTIETGEAKRVIFKGVKVEDDRYVECLINNEGIEISRNFKRIYEFLNGVARVEYNNIREGFLTLNGEELLKEEIDVVTTFSFYRGKGVFQRINGKYYTVTKTGKIEQVDYVTMQRFMREFDKENFGQVGYR